MHEIEPKKARKKPIVITYRIAEEVEDIKTLEGTMRASVGDYIITGVSGEEYPCKPDIFLKTYDLLEPPENDGEKGGNQTRGKTMSEKQLEEDRELLEGWLKSVRNGYGDEQPEPHIRAFIDGELVPLIEALLAAKERVVRSEYETTLAVSVFEVKDINPPQK